MSLLQLKTSPVLNPMVPATGAPRPAGPRHDGLHMTPALRFCWCMCGRCWKPYPGGKGVCICRECECGSQLAAMWPMS